MDTFVLNALVQELRHQICPSRVNAVKQPAPHTLFLELWHQRNSQALLISIAPQHQYIFLSDNPPEDQGLAPGKFFHHHLRGSEIRALHTPLLERIVSIELVKKDIDGQPLHFQLILEIMGRHSNLILLVRDTQKILESLRHVTAAQSSYRRIAPGAVYIPPPDQEKRDPTTVTQEEFSQILRNYELRMGPSQAKQLPLWKYLVQHFQGISPLLARDLTADAPPPEVLWLRFSQMMDCAMTETYQPHLLFSGHRQEPQQIRGVSAFPLQHTVCAPVPSMLHAIEQHYSAVIEYQEIQSLREHLLHSVRARLTKLQKKRDHLQQEQARIEQAAEYKQRGDLLMANLHQLHKGMREITVPDYYTEGQPALTIPLNPKLPPAQNAQRYFKRYSKLKQGRAMTQQRLQETLQEIAHLEEWSFFIESAETLAHLHSLRRELEEELPYQKRARRPVKSSSRKTSSQPFLRYTSSDGFAIYVGRSSKENDLLTQRTAHPDDIWLHVQHAPGSHVVILCRDQKQAIPAQTLQEAAALAAYHSKLRHSGKAEVMYTPKKHVKKPKGTPPGLVTVSQYQTLLVRPQTAENMKPEV